MNPFERSVLQPSRATLVTSDSGFGCLLVVVSSGSVGVNSIQCEGDDGDNEQRNLICVSLHSRSLKY